MYFEKKQNKKNNVYIFLKNITIYSILIYIKMITKMILNIFIHYIIIMTDSLKRPI